MPYSVKGFFEINEDMLQILLMLEVLFTQDSKDEDLFCGASSGSGSSLFFRHLNPACSSDASIASFVQDNLLLLDVLPVHRATTILTLLTVKLCLKSYQNEASVKGSLITPIRQDGWMTCDFTSFSTVFQSYQANGRVIMKGCVQWCPVYD